MSLTCRHHSTLSATHWSLEVCLRSLMAYHEHDAVENSFQEQSESCPQPVSEVAHTSTHYIEQNKFRSPSFSFFFLSHHSPHALCFHAHYTINGGVKGDCLQSKFRLLRQPNLLDILLSEWGVHFPAWPVKIKGLGLGCGDRVWCVFTKRSRDHKAPLNSSHDFFDSSNG